MNGSYHIWTKPCGRVMSHIDKTAIWKSHVIYRQNDLYVTWLVCICMRQHERVMSHMDKSWPTCERVRSLISASFVTYTSIKHVTHMDESCHTWTRHTYERVMSHISTSHVTYIYRRAVLHIWMCHVTRDDTSRHTNGRVVSHMTKSHHT